MGLKEKFKFDLTKTEDKLKLFILVSGSLLFILVAILGAFSATMSPSFCALCHKAMQPEYVTWQASSHSNIRCVDCHMEPGVIDIIIEKMAASKHLYEYATGGWEEKRPIKMKAPLPSHLCEQCHSIKTRSFTFSGDLIVPHEKHGEAGVECIQCHSGVAHGNISEREVTKEGDLGAWTADDGVKNMKAENVRPDMDKCVSCHINPAKYGIKNVKSVTWACEACHKSISTPATHQAPTWMQNHGVDAEKEFKGCVSCHTIGDNKPYTADGTKTNKMDTTAQAKDFAWKSEFCSNCHSQKPKNHENKDFWMPNHKNAVAAKGMKNCIACHSVRKTDSGVLASPAKEVACNNCHWFK